MKKVLILTTVLGLAATMQAQVRMNQVGLTPQQEKVAVVEGAVKASNVKILNAKTGKSVVKPHVLRTATSPFSKKKRTVLDFSQLKAEGDYVVVSGKYRQPFSIRNHALSEVSKGALKAFYLVRSGMPIEAQFAGEFARPAGHLDTKVMIHPSAVSPGRPAGSVISSPAGWYDAGDYNKYVVNSSYSIGLMLCAYQQCVDYFKGQNLGIPESKNQTADLLDEMMYNLKWLLTMQDPWDGGVYHKLTTPNFEGFVKPTDCHQQRYVVAKSTAATLDFAAVMAQAARLLKDNRDYPEFAEQAQRAALAAYHWAELHPKDFYQQEVMNRLHKPAVATGTYGDFFVGDEFFWAATELYLLTSDEKFKQDAEKHQPRNFRASSWASVAPLGVYEWLTWQQETELGQTCKKHLMAYCDSLVKAVPTSSFQTPSGNRAHDFNWGCLGGSFCSTGVALLFAYQMSNDSKYLTAARENADYVLGRNALGFCYVTGFGTKSPMNPHHRISAADGIEKPFPGLLVGGPNPGQQDKANVHQPYPSNFPDESYIDDAESYASNEIAINWNAELVSLMGWLDALN
ncbi:MAG: glycoside hydrolase family 9 protein [Prevotella sp.]|nr:glycoside hydrolase family 9 protein [Prevotella sp.]